MTRMSTCFERLLAVHQGRRLPTDKPSSQTVKVFGTFEWVRGDMESRAKFLLVLFFLMLERFEKA